jgi:hypothetical protein
MSDIATALFSLRQQSVARGLAGRAGDFDVRLCEDNRTVSLWAFYEMNPPLMASVELPAPIDPATFDALPYYRAALSAAR